MIPKDIIRKHPTDEQVEFCKKFLQKGSIAQRGKFDGTPEQQFYGLLAQIMVTDLLCMERPVNNGEHDNGVDFVLLGKKFDVKTETRNVRFNHDVYVHNMQELQIHYDTDFYVFCSYNKSIDELEICGYISKEELIARANHFKKGEMRKRTDGTEFEVVAGLYEIQNKYLTEFDVIISARKTELRAD